MPAPALESLPAIVSAVRISVEFTNESPARNGVSAAPCAGGHVCRCAVRRSCLTAGARGDSRGWRAVHDGADGCGGTGELQHTVHGGAVHAATDGGPDGRTRAWTETRVAQSGAVPGGRY